MNKCSSLIEISTIASYFFMVWGGYYVGISLGIEIIFVSLLISSIFSTVITGLEVAKWYKCLPNKTMRSYPYKDISTLKKARVCNTINTIIRRLFSGNFLVLLLTWKYGIYYAALTKLATTILNTLSAVTYNIFGKTGYALLAHYSNEKIEKKREAFNHISHPIHQIVCAIFLFFIINHKKFFTASWSIAFSLLIIYTIGYLFFAYEEFFVTQNSSFLLCIIHSVTGIILVAVLWYSDPKTTPPVVLLIRMIAIRAAAFILIAVTAFYQWRIKPGWSFQPISFIGSILLSLVIFFFIK